MTTAHAPGLLVLQGNRLELLRDAVFAWLAGHPLDPLEEEIFLVQSNAAAEWLKIEMAKATGIYAATRVALPARFVWSAYRAVLGPDRVPERPALDRDALVWRLMRLLPDRLVQSLFAPIAHFLADGGIERRLQLANRLADLYDDYQVHRPDWLVGWEAGSGTIDGPGGRRTIPDEQRWQPALWRDLVRDLAKGDAERTRGAVHRAFVDAWRAGAPTAEPLPERVILFGLSHLAPTVLEALVELTSRMSVLAAIPNPCRFQWSDLGEGREALAALGLHARGRHPVRGEVPPIEVPEDALHRHAHPLLAAWGRQGGDFMRQLEQFDETRAAQERFGIERVDLFDEGEPVHLLGRVQAAIRDLVPLAEHPRVEIPDDDRSIVFEIAHGPQREVEILHDRLLALFADHPAIRPRDVIVMVPDIATFAPAIRAVFDQHADDDPRRIPFTVADLKGRGSNPLVVAIEWLLAIDRHRARIGELRDLFDVPGIAARFGLGADDVRRVFAGASAAGVRWGLDDAHRAGLGLSACGAQNSWAFGLDRLLLGYAGGPGSRFDAIDADDDVGGLEAGPIGALVECVARVDAWLRAATPAPPATWASRCRDLLADFVEATDERERVTLGALADALERWLADCAAANFDEAVPLAVVREGWLDRLQGLEGQRRFLSGGVTFCTLMPLRAVPFEVVCLLGMDERAFPRRMPRNDFDLMGLPGQQRPGDRSRRDDDRYLMLEALLSARSMLHVSWAGRSARDNRSEPPSVLVAQLRDYLDAAFTGPAGRSVLDGRTTEHPLQPFSRRYFEGGDLVTHAREWREAHDRVVGREATTGPIAGLVDRALDLAALQSFLRHPVRAWFRDRLGVSVRDVDEVLDDDERFALDGLAQWQVVDDLVRVARDEGAGPEAVARRVEDGLARLAASGRLPFGDAGRHLLDAMRGTVRAMLGHWHGLLARYPGEAPRIRVRHAVESTIVEDWIDGLRAGPDGEAWITLTASRVIDGDAPRLDRLVPVWVTMLAAGAAGRSPRGYLVGPDGVLAIDPLPPDAAREAFDTLVAAWREAARRDGPPPFEAKTALAQVRDGDPRATYGGGWRSDGEVDRDFALARAYPEFDALVAAGFVAWADRLFAPLAAWAVDHVQVSEHGVETA